MKELFIFIRNKIIRLFYKGLLKNILFLTYPENTHRGALRAGQFWGAGPIRKRVVSLFFSYSNKKLEQEILDIKFKNPVGLAAGFDKDGYLTKVLPYLGFGFAEIGSITGEPCQGNPKPRVWRLKKSKGIVVYYGMPNNGCEEISQRLNDEKFEIPIGTNIAKTNCQETTETEKGIADYEKAFSKLASIGHFFTINISCPNAFGGQPFNDPLLLDKLLARIKSVPNNKPIFLKISPDLNPEQIDQIIDLAKKYRINGFICTNVTKNRNNQNIIENNIPEKGGVSGKPVRDLSDKLISYIYQKTKGEFIIIGCGGIFSAKDAYKKIKSGASLIELITGMIFEGPQLISEINQGLIYLTKKDGFENISQAIGKAD